MPSLARRANHARPKWPDWFWACDYKEVQSNPKYKPHGLSQAKIDSSNHNSWEMKLYVQNILISFLVRKINVTSKNILDPDYHNSNNIIMA